VEVVNSGDNEVRKLAIPAFRLALGHWNPPPPIVRKAVPALVEALKANDDELRHASTLALGVLRDEAGEALPALLEMSRADDETGSPAGDEQDTSRFTASPFDDTGPPAPEALAPHPSTRAVVSAAAILNLPGGPNTAPSADEPLSLRRRARRTEV
jgi:hypothetical protein